VSVATLLAHERLLTTTECAAELQITTTRMNQLIAAGAVEHYPTPIGKLIPAEALVLLVEHRRLQSLEDWRVTPPRGHERRPWEQDG
jgi:hypothetical protein